MTILLTNSYTCTVIHAARHDLLKRSPRTSKKELHGRGTQSRGELDTRSQSDFILGIAKAKVDGEQLISTLTTAALTAQRHSRFAAFQIFRKYPQLLSILATSGSEGWHLFVFSHGFHSVEDWVRLLKRIVHSIGADVKSGICEIFPNETRTGSRPHAIRAPGTWSPKTNQLGAIFFTSVAPLFQRERKKEVSSFLYHSTDGANAARLNDSCPPSFYCGGHQNWLEQFAITQPSTRHAQLRELVYCIFRQVSQPVGRRIADLQYQSARLQPKATLAEHLEEFEQLWTWMTTQWRAELSGAEEEIFLMLRTQIERDLFKILRNFARRAFSQKEKDFPFPLQHVAKRLGVSFQYVSKLRNRFVGASIIVQTAPAMANRLAARFRWCPQAD